MPNHTPFALLSVALVSTLLLPPLTAREPSARVEPPGGPAVLELEKGPYLSDLKAFWLAQCIANWTGLTSELMRSEPPFLTDADWGVTIHPRRGHLVDWVVQDPWLADDDTDIEYVYVFLLHKHRTTTLTPNQIAEGWKRHINRSIWVSNRRARDLMEDGVLPPATGRPPLNEHALMIDAQLTTEVFGVLAPAMPEKALEMAHLPIRTTADGFAADAAEFHVLLHAYAPRVDKGKRLREQVLWLVEQARAHLDDASKSADIVDFVLQDYRDNPDVNDWERTRDRIYARYQRDAAAHGFEYLGNVESSVNFANSLLCLLYGQGNLKRTIQVGTLGGWDSDNPTASMAALVGQLIGYDAIHRAFPQFDLSDRYVSSRTRDHLPDFLPDDLEAEDSFELMVRRMEPTIDRAVREAGGEVHDDRWIIPLQ